MSIGQPVGQTHFLHTHNPFAMKHKSLLALAALALMAFLSGCLRDDCTSYRTFTRFDPIYKTLAECRVGIASQSPRELRQPGKIYAFGDYLFINEKKEGIHVVDNSDPANPQRIAFWSIPGNVDIAIRGDRLYADQYMDLLMVDISDFQNPQLVCRTENAFPLFGFDPQRGFIVDYTQTEITEKVGCDDSRWNNQWFFSGPELWVADVGGSAQSNGGSGVPAAVGIAGSYARFGLINNYLYTVDQAWLRTWSLISNCPTRTDSVYVGWNIETIFPWKDKLFIGSQTGVFIFDNSNPARPVQEAQFSHATGCDPVVCDDKYAYVTIHDGTTCNGTFNQLDIIGIENLPNTQLQKVYEMKRPFGLAVTNEHLFLCDDGLKIFDKSDPLDLKQLSHLKSVAAYDVIAFSDAHLLLVGDQGFYQFDVSDPAAPRQMSLLPVVK
jgi:hypothetical protein